MAIETLKTMAASPSFFLANFYIYLHTRLWLSREREFLLQGGIAVGRGGGGDGGTASIN